MSELVSFEVDGNVAVIVINNPPVNALSPGVPEGIQSGIERALADAGIDAVVIVGGGRTFIAGADIRQLEKLARGEVSRGGSLKNLLLLIEQSDKPVVAAIHGTALGGGLELAMACHYRVAEAGSQVGQPEVKLGIIPGAAGTQRLPRLIGIGEAAAMCAFGDPIPVERALELGLVDAIVASPIRESAVEFARQKGSERSALPRTADRTDKLAMTPACQQSLAETRRRAERMKEPSPALRAIAAVEAAGSLSFAAGCQREEELFEESIRSPVAQGLMHVFFGQREVAKIPGLSSDTAVLSVKRVGILGAGTMGTGIATAYAASGFEVLWQDESKEALDRGVAQARSFLERMAGKSGWSKEELSRKQEGIKTTTGLVGFDQVDLVIEAAFENLELKRKIFAELGQRTKPGAILASNTSTLDIDSMAEASTRPEWVVGHHFFSPAHVMKLVEVVRGAKTRPDVLATSMQLAKRLGKVGVLVGNARGFVGNRMYGPYQREAQFLVEEGASPEQVDRVMEAFGMAMGPLAVGDLAGLDVGYRVRQESAHLVPAGWRVPRVSDRLCELGRFGQKVGKGWYQYGSGSRDRQSDPAVAAVIEEVARSAGLVRRTVSDAEIEERILLALALEGIACLEEGLAIRPVDIDIIYVLGYGFPGHKGGPMFWADHFGLEKIYHRARELEKTQGPWWKPAKLLASLVGAGQTLEGWSRSGKKFAVGG
jgi:3-hydroxyacyl-CoA dehydrogenase